MGGERAAQDLNNSPKVRSSLHAGSSRSWVACTPSRREEESRIARELYMHSVKDQYNQQGTSSQRWLAEIPLPLRSPALDLGSRRRPTQPLQLHRKERGVEKGDKLYVGKIPVGLPRDRRHTVANSTHRLGVRRTGYTQEPFLLERNSPSA